jgi:glycerate-2-kinase
MICSNPSINLKELKSAMQKGTIKNVKITETISGKVTTVGEVYNNLINILEKVSEEDRKE